MQTMHLFAGIGGGLLADLILGHKPIVAVEWEPYACRVLRERAAEGWFPGLHVWEGDVRLFDPSEYAGRVDCIHAGFPCQDISVAGKQAGVSEGTRSGLYREVLRIAGIVRPRFLFLENVAAILSNGLGTVLGDLAAMGYDCRWLCIRASDVGAPHHRDRWWLLADSKRVRPAAGTQGEAWRSLSNGIRISASEERQRHELESWPCSDSEVLADSISNGQQEQRPFRNAISSEERENREATRAVDGSFQGVWSIEPGLGRVANGIPNRIHRLKGLGNAQVPIQAATAWRLLGGE
jgi:DNA (cytosine-5)-methyltransferase 1